MTILREIPCPDDLPQSERHVTCEGPQTLAEALALIRDRYARSRINMERVYFTLSDNRYWFILKGKQ